MDDPPAELKCHLPALCREWGMIPILGWWKRGKEKLMTNAKSSFLKRLLQGGTISGCFTYHRLGENNIEPAAVCQS